MIMSKHEIANIFVPVVFMKKVSTQRHRFCSIHFLYTTNRANKCHFRFFMAGDAPSVGTVPTYCSGLRQCPFNAVVIVSAAILNLF